MISARKWTWQTWAILLMGLLIMLGWIPQILDANRDRDFRRAVSDLPTTASFFHVSYVQLDRNEAGHLVVYTDAYEMQPFEGRFKVAFRDRETARHMWTPRWSDWLSYRGNPTGTRYRQPETLQWWAGLEDDAFIEPPRGSWIMETCWQARIDHPLLGLTELEPVCVTSLLNRDEAQRPIHNEVTP